MSTRATGATVQSAMVTTLPHRRRAPSPRPSGDGRRRPLQLGAAHRGRRIRPARVPSPHLHEDGIRRMVDGHARVAAGNRFAACVRSRLRTCVCPGKRHGGDRQTLAPRTSAGGPTGVTAPRASVPSSPRTDPGMSGSVTTFPSVATPSPGIQHSASGCQPLPQSNLPAIQLEDGSWYRKESSEMAEEISAGALSDRRPGP